MQTVDKNGKEVVVGGTEDTEDFSELEDDMGHDCDEHMGLVDDIEDDIEEDEAGVVSE
jgi:hypothetical protein